MFREKNMFLFPLRLPKHHFVAIAVNLVYTTSTDPIHRFARHTI